MKGFNFSKKNRKISSLFLIYVYIISTVFVVIVGGYWIISDVSEFNDIADRLRKDYIHSQKDIIKKQTNLVIDYINYSRSNIERKLKESLKGRVNESWVIADNLYKTYKGKKTEREIKSLIKTALRPVRFNNEKCFYTIYDLNGNALLYPISSDIEGKCLINLKDNKGETVVREMIELAKSEKEGFVYSYWPKVDQNNYDSHQKITYVKYFAPFNWILVSEGFLNDFEQEVKKDVLNRIRKIRYGKEGYVFVNTYDGVALVIDSEIHNPGDTIWELTDPNGVKVVQEERKAVENPDGDYIHYTWKKLKSSNLSEKISFIKGIDNWEWMVGTGFYLDEINEYIDIQKTELSSKLKKRTLLTLIILAAILVVIYITARRYSNRIQINFDQFLSNLKDAVKNNEAIESDKFELKDLQILSNSVNTIINDKRTSENALAESEERFRTIFENAPVMILVFDKNLNLKTWNKEANQKLGNRLVPNLKFREILTNSDVVAKQPSLKLSDIKGKFREFQIKNNGDTYNQLWASFLTSENEMISVGYDITALKQIQQKLDKANKTKDLFFSIISHDLQSPFNALIGFANLLLDDFNQLDDSTKIQYLQQIKSSSEGMYELLLSLLDWSRAQLDKIEIEISEFDLNDAIKNSIATHQNQAVNKKISLKSNVEEEFLVKADYNMTLTILRNIISNAIKFTEIGGQINVFAKKANGYVQITVTDNGIGISKDNIQKLFRIDNSYKRYGTLDEKGSGFGLIICKEFIEKMGGEIGVNSRLGEGSEFYFTLPLE
jgi:PAS domain S-box-containing protein